MKVVLFCGGLGLRLRDSENTPKPLVGIGYRPILWHVMKYYAHFGHRDFILCLGYRADLFKSYFLNYNECMSNDFVFSDGGRQVTVLGRDIDDWRITFADTGIHANIGMRLRAVERYLEGEEIFLANYSDGLTDLTLDDQLADFAARDCVASFLAVRPNLSYHVVRLGPEGWVDGIQEIRNSDLRINGGFFVLRREIFRYLGDGEELVIEPFGRLIAERRLVAYPYDGFWVSMDTYKDKQRLEEIYGGGNAPWELWRVPGAARPPETLPPVGGASRVATLPVIPPRSR